MLDHTPGTMIQSPAVIEVHICAGEQVSGHTGQFRAAFCRVLYGEEFFRETSEIMNRSGHFHSSHHCPFCFPVCRDTNDRFRLGYTFSRIAESLYKFILLNCIHRTTMS
ncbi:hypothetical protein D3C86_1764410 [compost metagenome]